MQTQTFGSQFGRPGLHLSAIALFVALFLSCSSSVGVQSAKAPTDDALINALRGGNAAAIAGMLAPDAYFQYAIVHLRADAKEQAALRVAKGNLYAVLFSDEILAQMLGKGSPPSFATAFRDATSISVRADPLDRHYLASVSTVHRDFCYDVILNCNGKATCEIAGFNISGCANFRHVALRHPTKSPTYQTLAERDHLKESRAWLARGIPKYVLDDADPKKRVVHGPNHRFRVLTSGPQHAYGFATTIEVAERYNIAFQHLTQISSTAHKAAGTGEMLAPGTFIGGNGQPIGFANPKKPALTIEGRTNNGFLLTEDSLLKILRGAPFQELERLDSLAQQASLWDFARTQAPPPEEVKDLYIDARVPALALDLVYLGKTRTIPSERANTFGTLQSLSNFKDFIEHFKQEALFRHKGKEVWLATQAPIADLLVSEFQPGQRLTGYVRFVGCCLGKERDFIALLINAKPVN